MNVPSFGTQLFELTKNINKKKIRISMTTQRARSSAFHNFLNANDSTLREMLLTLKRANKIDLQQ